MKHRLSPSFMRSLRSMWLPLALAAGFVGGMWTGSILPGRRNAVGDNKFNTVMQLIQSQYVDPVNADSLMELTLPDLLGRLDPHSVYIPASELTMTNDELAGSFSGIGVSFQISNDTILIVEVIAGGPAEKVGLKPGDRIVSVDDTIAAGRGWTNSRVMQTLRGPEGSLVKLGVKRPMSAGIHDFTLTRGEIPVTSVDAAYMIDDEAAYIKVNRFGSQTYAEFITAMAGLMADGAEKFIIDLRGNGGGFMEPAILMANEFLPAGAGIVSTRGRMDYNNQEIRADGTGSFRGVQLVVMLDENSASASEIFAGAIQDNDRGLVIGRRSFGKGLVQNQISLSDSSAVRLTVARYYTPSGRCIQKTYTPGNLDSYNSEIYNRFTHGEAYSADSIHLDESVRFMTVAGRPVFGGGGIMPDVFVPNDTTGVTSWYLSAMNAGLLQRFALDYLDANRARLSTAKDIDALNSMLPADEEMAWNFARYAGKRNVVPRWSMVNTSTPLLVNQLKALIARDVLGKEAFYMILNDDDATLARAIEELREGHAAPPVKIAPRAGAASPKRK